MLVWEEHLGVPLLRWRAVDGVVAAFSGRRGGVSDGPFASLNLGLLSGDDVARVAENRRRLCAAVGADPSRTGSCRQEHGATVHVVDAPPSASFDDPAVLAPAGDGLVTASPGRALVAFAADCVPVLLARRDGSAVAACHAGWRGLVAGVVEATVRALGGEAVAAVGPCAGAERYAVQADVAGPLVARFGDDVAGGGTVDLARCASRALHAAGVEDVEQAGLCTIADAGRFYSHRRDGAPGGRQGAIVFREAARG